MSTQTAYIVMMNDCPMYSVLGNRVRAQKRLEELRDNYWTINRFSFIDRNSYNLRCNWHIIEVDGEAET